MWAGSGQIDSTKSEAWQRGWAEAQEWNDFGPMVLPSRGDRPKRSLLITKRLSPHTTHGEENTLDQNKPAKFKYLMTRYGIRVERTDYEISVCGGGMINMRVLHCYKRTGDRKWDFLHTLIRFIAESFDPI
jgi:hypothetical protein